MDRSTENGAPDHEEQDDYSIGGATDERPPRNVPVAVQVGISPCCPFCGDTLWGIRPDGTAMCVHDGTDIWIPPSLRSAI